MNEWKEYKLGEVADVQTGPFGSQLHQSDYVAYGIPSIMPVNIGNRLNITTDKIVYVSEEDANRLKKYRVKEGDIVYSRRGDVEKCAYIRTKENGWLCGTGCLRIRIDMTMAYPRFVAYFLSTEEVKSWISNNAVGTTMPNLNSGILQCVDMLLPPIEEQKRIAGVLGSLDDKIDLLNRENATLEALAETLFRHYFIEIPNPTWKEGKLGDEFIFTMGQSPSGDSFNEDGIGIPMYQGNADFGFRFPTRRVYTTAPTRFAEENDTLISVRAPVGAQNMASERCCIGRGVAAFRHKDKSLYSYTYYKLKSLLEDIRQFNDNGTVFGSISKSDFENIDIVIPNRDSIVAFQEQATPIDEKIRTNYKQILVLSAQRDSLLPRLMSGETKVTGQ